MRIGILSDTHDQVARTARAVASLIDEGAEALIHCGDFTQPRVVEELAGLPHYVVLGNNDYDENGLRRVVLSLGGVWLGRGGLVECGGKRLAVTHGDSFGEIRRLKEQEPDYLFLGHSHQRDDHREGPTRWINPGALHRAPEWTVALLDLDTDALTVLRLGRDR
ncbi:MAG: metallophosphoesterase [Isosphaeraceae bacterium]